ncbi:MAG: endolytic transglycosylase MltG [Lachnospiraceae bacterium]|nr:endolytic transglycosylase MltG [Lachnospiraceae bacterium]
MKLKYYLRGAGIALIVVSLIWIVAGAFEGDNISQEKIETEAKKLGMVYPDDNKTLDEADKNKDENTDNQTDINVENTDDNNATEQADSENNQEGETSSDDLWKGQTDDMVETVQFNISSGESSYTVSKHLQEQGLVDDANNFDRFLTQSDSDNALRPGNYTIPKGASYEDINNILMGR